MPTARPLALLIVSTPKNAEINPESLSFLAIDGNRLIKAQDDGNRLMKDQYDGNRRMNAQYDGNLLIKAQSLDVQRMIQYWKNTSGQYILYSDNHELLEHAVMQMKSYIHITSPIRRMVDLLNQMSMSDFNPTAFPAGTVGSEESPMQEPSRLSINPLLQKEMEDKRKKMFYSANP